MLLANKATYCLIRVRIHTVFVAFICTLGCILIQVPSLKILKGHSMYYQTVLVESTTCIPWLLIVFVGVSNNIIITNSTSILVYNFISE